MFPRFLIKELHTKNRFWLMQKVFLQLLWVFSTTYYLILTVKISNYVGPHFVLKNKISNTWSISCEKTKRCRLQNYRPTCGQQNWSKAVNLCWRLGKCWKCPWQRGRGGELLICFTFCSPCILVLVFIHLTNDCSIIINYLSLVPYICFSLFVAIIRSSLIYIHFTFTPSNLALLKVQCKQTFSV
jgi:hypothetical protein